MEHDILIRSKLFLTITVILLCGILSCNSAGTESSTVSETTGETSTGDNLEVSPETVPAPGISQDTAGVIFGDDSMVDIPSINYNKYNPREKPTVLPEMKVAKGIAMVYCPAKMIEGLPSIVSATLTKEEISSALKEFRKRMGEENPEATMKEIENDIKSETIDLYKNMAVKLEFDPDVFKISPKEAIITKSFGDKKQLNWEWDITPLRTTERSFIHFKFYYTDAANNTMEEILDKRISVDVKVDNRAFLDKWKTFLLGDPKTTTTAILIPLATFLGGFLTGKKNKKTV